MRYKWYIQWAKKLFHKRSNFTYQANCCSDNKGKLSIARIDILPLAVPSNRHLVCVADFMSHLKVNIKVSWTRTMMSLSFQLGNIAPSAAANSGPWRYMHDLGVSRLIGRCDLLSTLFLLWHPSTIESLYIEKRLGCTKCVTVRLWW